MLYRAIQYVRGEGEQFTRVTSDRDVRMLKLDAKNIAALIPSYALSHSVFPTPDIYVSFCFIKNALK